jgi:hypothetical protein
VRLAKVSPVLRLALDDNLSTFRFDETEFKHIHAQEVEIAHGLKVYLRNESVDEYLDTYQIVKKAVIAAEDSAVHFEALLLACGRILDADAELHPQLRYWLANHLLGRTKPPPRKRGPDPYPNLERDHLLVYFFRHIAQLGYPITESEASYAQSSACHAVNEALADHFELPSVKRLMNIWSNRHSQR